VIVSSCGHSGIINTINYAKKLVGVEKIHAVLGGFHLSGSLHEETIAPTVGALHEAAPDFVVPCHCTGWKAINTIIQYMPLPAGPDCRAPAMSCETNCAAIAALNLSNYDDIYRITNWAPVFLKPL
jgi:hypothetical protein